MAVRRLFDLPLEIRELIYEHYFRSCSVRILPYRNGRHDDGSTTTATTTTMNISPKDTILPKLNTINILRTSKAVYEEALPFFYSKTFFSFSDTSLVTQLSLAIKYQVRRIGLSSAQTVRELEFLLTMEDFPDRPQISHMLYKQFVEPLPPWSRRLEEVVVRRDYNARYWILCSSFLCDHVRLVREHYLDTGCRLAIYAHLPHPPDDPRVEYDADLVARSLKKISKMDFEPTEGTGIRPGSLQAYLQPLRRLWFDPRPG